MGHQCLEPNLVPTDVAVSYVSNRGGSMDLSQQAVTEDGRPIGEPLTVTPGLGI